MTTYTGFPTTSVGTTKSGSMAGKNQASCQEYSIRVPKNNKKNYHVMRFNSNLQIDFLKWKNQNVQIKLERENNYKEFKGTEEEMPKFGAGSEFGREAKEEARRKKYGIISKKYKSEDQPWILKQGGKSGKKYRGIREGGVSDNTSYYVFTQAGSGIIEAYPLNEWYNFQPIQRYKALTAEEAEEEFGRRHKVLNYFHLMTRKRLRNEQDEVLDDPDEIKGKKNASKKKKKESELKISEMDDWVDSDEDNSGSSDEEGKKKEEEEDGGKGKKKPNKKNAKKKKKDSDDEAFEESDDGDEEGRELDYISDSSESASDHEMKANKELKGVAEEDALRKLLNSESESEEEEKKDENESNSEEDDEKKEKDDKEKDKTKDENHKKKSKKVKKKKSKTDVKKNLSGGSGSSSELSPNSSDSDSDSNSTSKKKPNSKSNKDSNSAGSSRSATPTLTSGEKRKATASELAVAATKKAKLESNAVSSPTSFNNLSGNDTGVTEDAVRRYLMRKPMTTTELLHKFKAKKTGLTSEQLVNVMTQILKNINPVKQTIKNKMYLSIKKQ